MKINPITIGLLDVEAKRSASGNVVKTQPVLPRFDLEIWPRLPIDFYNVADEVVLFIRDGNEISRVVIHFICDHEWNVIFAGGEIEAIFGRIVDDVGADKTLETVRRRDRIGVIVVPNGPGVLIVRVIIVLELPIVDAIVGPAIPWGMCPRAMQVNDRIICVIVVITDHGLCAFLNVVCWSRMHSIVANKVCRAEIRVNLLLERFYSDFIKVYLLPVHIGRAV